MSYDVSLEVNTGAEESIEIWSVNYTSNMWYCLDEFDYNIDQFHDMNANDAIPMLEKIIELIQENEERLRLYEPANKWGSVDGFLNQFLIPIKDACIKHPKTKVRVSK